MRRVIAACTVFILLYVATSVHSETLAANIVASLTLAVSMIVLTTALIVEYTGGFDD